ncbi:hypothetical protein R4Z09_26210 [Niallia oryzisoli]|uniref:Uncharacterized protein n=1 Tax=Niallia oryzisoli TaxID=1737571 RepID=A0ABZ2CBN6_9BACI
MLPALMAAKFAKIPFEKLTATSPLQEHQLKMIRQMSTKRQWSNRVQIKIIRLARNKPI